MIDRLVHHAEILALKGGSYRLCDKELGAGCTRRLIAPPAPLRPTGLAGRPAYCRGQFSTRHKGVSFQPALALPLTPGANKARSAERVTGKSGV